MLSNNKMKMKLATTIDEADRETQDTFFRPNLIGYDEQPYQSNRIVPYPLSKRSNHIDITIEKQSNYEIKELKETQHRMKQLKLPLDDKYRENTGLSKTQLARFDEFNNVKSSTDKSENRFDEYNNTSFGIQKEIKNSYHKVEAVLPKSRQKQNQQQTL